MHEKRKHIRTEFSGHVRLMHASFDGDIELVMRDMSDGGVFLFSGEQVDLPVGERVQIQSLDIDDAPLLEAQVVRCDQTGIALMFVWD